jgi:outer membrane protein assembly factor BamB
MRITKLTVIGALALLMLSLPAGPLAAQQKPRADWPCWRGRAHDGQTPEIPAAMPKLKQLWKQRLAGRCDAGVAAAEGVVVVADSDGRRSDYYWCFDAETGKQRWLRKVPNPRKMAYGSAPRATPCIYQGKVITLGAFGDLHCYDLKTGKPVWEKDYHKDFGAPARPPEWGYSVPPVLVDGKLILMPGDLVALDPNTGKLIWRAKTAGANYAAFTPAKAGGKRQVIGYDEAGVGGYDVATGERIWSMPVNNSNGYIVPAPVMVGDKLLLATETPADKGDGAPAYPPARLFAFGPDGKVNPAPVGENKLLAPQMSTPTVAADVVLGVTDGLICLDPADRLKTLWTQEQQDAFLGMAHVVANGDRAMIFGDKGEMVMVRATRDKCEVLGKANLCPSATKSSVVWSHPAIAGGSIFARDEKYIYAWRMLPGAEGK